MVRFNAAVSVSFVLYLALGLVEGGCKATVAHAAIRACPAGLRDDGKNCWKDPYGRGVGRIPDKSSCPSGTRDDGTSCWNDSYGRGVGRIPDKAPCPSGLRDDGISCWRDAHIYGKGCCCVFWNKGCCKNCKSGYNDDGCTCRKTDIGIKMTLFQRQTCRSGEDKYGALCYPKCKTGYRAVGCCICQPEGKFIIKTLKQRQSCRSDEERYLALCYPQCKAGYRPEGCCICRANGAIAFLPLKWYTLSDRYYCTGDSFKFQSVCMTIESSCALPDLVHKIKDLGIDLTSEQIEQLKELLQDIGKLLN